MSQDTILSALLDYYSDKASASATLVISVTFGLFAIVTLLENWGQNPWMFLIFWILCGAGLYVIMSFRLWALHATWAKNFLVGRNALDPAEHADIQIESRARDEWERTILRNLYTYIKFQDTRLSLHRWFDARERQGRVSLNSMIPTFFLGFALIVSTVFFKEWWHVVTHFAVLIVLLLDFSSLMWGRVITRTFRSAVLLTIFAVLVILIICQCLMVLANWSLP